MYEIYLDSRCKVACTFLILVALCMGLRDGKAKTLRLSICISYNLTLVPKITWQAYIYKFNVQILYIYNYITGDVIVVFYIDQMNL